MPYPKNKLKLDLLYILHIVNDGKMYRRASFNQNYLERMRLYKFKGLFIFVS
jgi:hypothetical protein